MTNNCKFCSKDISTLRSNAEYCNKDCRKYDYNNIRTEKLRITSIEEYKNASKDSYVACKICGHCAPDLSNHILKIHKISAGDYKEQLKVNVVKCKDLCDTVRGENNPGFQHGGKLSIFSDNFLHNDGSEEFKNKQAEIKQKAYDNSLAKPENRSTTIEYWKTKGCTDDEAKKNIFDRQQTFTLEKCIKRYGKDNGQTVWQDRQIKWQETLNNKSDEEKSNINRSKAPVHHMKHLWKADYPPLPGVFYMLVLENDLVKIGITKNSLYARYGLKKHLIKNVVVEENMELKRAFMCEQIIKKEFYGYRIKKHENTVHKDFGWTEVFKISANHLAQRFIELKHMENLESIFKTYFPKEY